MIKLKALLDENNNVIKIKDGISYKNDKLDIDLNRDWFDDIVKVNEPGLNNKTFSRSGITVFFGYVLTSPDTFTKPEATYNRNAIRSLIKNYDRLPSEDLSKITTLLNYSIKQLNAYKPLNSFDMLVSVESTAPFNKFLIQQIKPYLRSDVLIVDNMFMKNNIQNIDLDWDLLDKEKSEKTKEMVLNMYEKILKSKSLFFIKDLKASVRRYFIKFLKFSDNIQANTFEHIFGKNILLVDDTVGEVSTFKDMVRLLSMYKPKEYLCYAFLKDY